MVVVELTAIRLGWMAVIDWRVATGSESDVGRRATVTGGGACVDP